MQEPTSGTISVALGWRRADLRAFPMLFLALSGCRCEAVGEQNVSISRHVLVENPTPVHYESPSTARHASA